MAELVVWVVVGVAIAAVGLLLAAFVVGFVGYFVAIAFGVGFKLAAASVGIEQ